MKVAVAVLMFIVMLATVGVLLAGVFGMARGSDPARSNQLMRWRIMLQAGALILFAILMMILKS